MPDLQLSDRTDVDAPPGFWVRDDEHATGPRVPLWDSVWCEPYTRGFAEAFARWGYLGDGVAGTVIGGWFYTSFRPLSDPGLVPVRIARAADAAAADEHLSAATDWADVTGPGFERQRLRLAAGPAEAGAADRFEQVARLVREVIRCRFAALGIQELVTEWVLLAGERYGWDAERALALAARPASGRARTRLDLSGVVAAIASSPELRHRLDAGAVPTLDELRAEPAVAQALAGFLDHSGDTLLAFDITAPTIAERPAHLPRAIAAAWTAGRHDAPQQTPRPADEDVLDAEARAALDRARIGYPQRDDSNELAVRCLGLLRRLALDAGVRLGLPEPADAMLFTAEELAAALRDERAGVDRDLLAARREAHRLAAEQPPPPVLGDPPPPPPDGSMLPAPAARAMARIGLFVELLAGPRARPSGTDLVGVPAAVGRYTGVVRLARDPADAHTVEPGEVLVCPLTGPAWNLAMARAGALVCDTGGQLSHAAITARELGIPAVVGCRHATATLRTGDRVVVDGAAGTVLPL